MSYRNYKVPLCHSPNKEQTSSKDLKAPKPNNYKATNRDLRFLSISFINLCQESCLNSLSTFPQTHTHRISPSLTYMGVLSKKETGVFTFTLQEGV